MVFHSLHLIEFVTVFRDASFTSTVPLAYFYTQEEHGQVSRGEA